MCLLKASVLDSIKECVNQSVQLPEPVLLNFEEDEDDPDMVVRVDSLSVEGDSLLVDGMEYLHNFSLSSVMRVAALFF